MALFGLKSVLKWYHARGGQDGFLYLFRFIFLLLDTVGAGTPVPADMPGWIVRLWGRTPRPAS